MAAGPEILIEGVTSAQVESVEHISAGIWQITVIYPEENQLFYVSVRVQGKTIKNLFRFQHVEI